MLRRLLLALVVCTALASAAAAQTHVTGHFRRDGTSVPPHYRSVPDGNPYNNWSTPRRGLDPTIPLQAGQGVTPLRDPLQTLGTVYQLQQQQQEIRLRQLQIEMLQRHLQGGR